MKLAMVINNGSTLAYCNGYYYVYTVSVVGNNIYVNFDRVGESGNDNRRAN